MHGVRRGAPILRTRETRGLVGSEGRGSRRVLNAPLKQTHLSPATLEEISRKLVYLRHGSGKIELPGVTRFRCRGGPDLTGRTGSLFVAPS
ncbi:hypothetical protein E2C01_079115 [Portunus trituberculatus]|uniref:Uncharacterized protein n=1 Tax=Portunus trituberculatus TaxID=210409 RepID=A0A5B7ISF5_PORTR|nr:hypothetical protein [Portunus trituberculatus]